VLDKSAYFKINNEAREASAAEVQPAVCLVNRFWKNRAQDQQRGSIDSGNSNSRTQETRSNKNNLGAKRRNEKKTQN
jgi:hypothetical protein